MIVICYNNALSFVIIIMRSLIYVTFTYTFNIIEDRSS